MLKGRHRSPVGIGQRIAPDDSPQGGPYAVSSSGYHRSFGRGVGKYQRGPAHLRYLAPPPPSKEDILMEAGRLAAEYLVAQGILPASSLPPPPRRRRRPQQQQQQQNCGFQEFKVGRERDPSSARMSSALDRLGSWNPEPGHGRRRYGEEHPPPSYRGRGKRLGSYNSWTGRGVRESGRAPRVWMERPRGFDECVMEEDEDPAPGYRRRWSDNYGSSGSGLRPSKAVTDGEVSCRGEAVESESDLVDDNDGGGDGGCVKPGLSPIAKEEGSHDTVFYTKSNRDGDASEADDMETELDVATESADVETRSADVEKKNEMEVELGLMPQPAETDQVGKNGEELLRFCRYPEVPTKRRSSLGNRGAKKVQGLAGDEVGSSSKASTNEPENQQDEPVVAEKEMVGESPEAEQEEENAVAVVVECEKEGQVVDTDDADSCSRDSFASAIRNANLAKQDSDVMPLCPIDECTNPSPAIEDEKKTSVALPSFPKSSPVQHPSELVTEASLSSGDKPSVSSCLLPESSSSAPIQVDSNKSLLVPEASAVASNATADDGFAQQSSRNKRARDWYTEMISQADDCGNPRDLNGKHFGSRGGKQIIDEEMVDAPDQKKDKARLSWKTEAQPRMSLGEDRQLLPNSFKICDLNLMGTPEATEIPRDPVEERGPDTTAILQTGNVPSVEFGLSVGNDNRRNDIYGQSSNGNKAVQVIDLEDDSPVNTGACDPSKPRNEAIYRNLECFLDNPESAVDLPDIQDGYGHAITDLLGSDITSCPSVAADINGLQPGMPLHGAEGMAGDDDSIYVSLGEIPIDFMDIWDPPHQEYGKYF